MEARKLNKFHFVPPAFHSPKRKPPCTRPLEYFAHLVPSAKGNKKRPRLVISPAIMGTRMGTEFDGGRIPGSRLIRPARASVDWIQPKRAIKTVAVESASDSLREKTEAAKKLTGDERGRGKLPW